MSACRGSSNIVEINQQISWNCVCQILIRLCFDPPDNQEGSDWRDEDEKLPGHENLTEKDIELFRHIQELALQVRRP